MRKYGTWRKRSKRFQVREFPYTYWFRNELRRMESQGRARLTNRSWDFL